MLNFGEYIVFGLPEVILNTLIGLTLLEGSVKKYFKKEKYIWLKIILASIVTILIISLSKVIITNLGLSTLFSYIVFIGLFRFIYKANIRQSFIVSSLLILTMMILDMSTLTLYFELSKSFKHIDLSYFIILVRVLQILIIITLSKLKVNIKINMALKKNWIDLPKGSKLSYILILILSSLAIYINSYYSEFIISISIEYLASNKYFILIYFAETITFIGILLILINKIVYYENFKMLTNNLPENIISQVNTLNSSVTINTYLTILSKYIKIDNYDKLTNYLFNLKSKNPDFIFLLDAQLKKQEFNYSILMFIVTWITEYFKASSGHNQFIEFSLDLIDEYNLEANVTISLSDESDMSIVLLDDLDFQYMLSEWDSSYSSHEISCRDKMFTIKFLHNYNYLKQEV